MTARWPLGLGLFVAGAVVGGLLVASRSGQPEKTPFGRQMTTALQDSSNRVVTLEAELKQANTRIAKSEADTIKLAMQAQQLANPDGPGGGKPSRITPAANPLAALFGGAEGEDNPAGKAMKGLMEAALQQQLDGKLGLMKTKLNLTPEQETAIRGILEKQFGQGRALAEKMMTGKATQEELADVTQQQQGNPEQAIKDLLSPEQQTAYDELQVEERRNNARLMANTELLQMQGALGLSQDQQDAVFQALYAETERQFTPGAPGQVPDFRGALDRKLAALKPVLSAEQLQRYQAMQEQQLKLIESMLPKDGKPGDVVLPNVQVLPAPTP
jgi:hypothetical protein